MSNKIKKTTFKDAINIFKMINKKVPSFMPIVIIRQLLDTTIPFINIVLGARIIDMLYRIVIDNSSDITKSDIMVLVIIMVLSNMIIGLIMWVLDKVLIIKRRRIDNEVTADIGLKAITMDYQVFEKNETMNMLQDASEGMNTNGGLTSYCQVIGFVIGNIISIIYSGVILIGLFTGLTSGTGEGLVYRVMSSPISSIILLAIVALIITNFMNINKRQNQLQYEFFKENVKANREFSFFFSLMYSEKYMKDTRIFNMNELFMSEANKRSVDIDGSELRKLKKYIKLISKKTSNNELLELVSYIFVGARAVSGIISLGSLTLYVGTLRQFTVAFDQMMNNIQWLEIMTNYIKNYSEFLEIKNEKYDGTLPIEKRLDNEYELEFRNVSFHYPNSEEDILKNITINIKVGKKMAIVGQNGAGKSTFIKLLCRLYDPTEGEILLNGIDIRKYDYDEYMSIFAVVFQDYQLFAFPLGQNVATATEYDKDKAMKCLEQAGIADRVKNMPEGLDTYLYNEQEGGVEISGGEAQKIAIARALYKDAPVVIMDEPTSALDPISELEIYEKFDSMVEDKTAIYISHRMSSCRFCNNILVFEDGKIIQKGSHNELLKAEEGLYYRLWNAQAQYYR